MNIFVLSNAIKMRVKELLREKGMTAKELAARLGMTETAIRAILL